MKRDVLGGGFWCAPLKRVWNTMGSGPWCAATGRGIWLGSMRDCMPCDRGGPPGTGAPGGAPGGPWPGIGGGGGAPCPGPGKPGRGPPGGMDP